MSDSLPFPPSVVPLASAYDFDATLARLKAGLAAAGAVVFADIDQREAAAQAGLALRRTRLILFGNPRAGTPVMAANPHAALELPLRLVVWEDDAGRTQLDYLDVTQTLGPLYGIADEQCAPLLKVPALLRSLVR